MAYMNFGRTLCASALPLALCLGLAAPGAAGAQSFQFTGTRENVNPITPPGGRCVPPYFNTVTIAPGAISSTGTSNLGPFTSTQSHCISSSPPTPVSEGLFTYTFRAGDTITGTYTGNVTNSGTPGLFNAVENLVITGGTGRFTGATGMITSDGQLRFGPGPTGIFAGKISGSVNATQSTTGTFGTAVGSPSAATGDYSTAVGALAIATGARSLAVGAFAEATGPGSIAIGDRSLANALNATALGQETTAQGIASTALGHNADATALASTAVGVSAQATGMGSTALGRIANASAAGSTALGASAAATFANSTAVGTGAATTAANQVSLGGTGSSVRVGDVAASTAAQSGPVSVATVDASGTLGVNSTLIPTTAALQTASTTQAGQIETLFDLADHNRRDIRRAYEGVAMALAMDSPGLSSGARFAVSGGIGVYGDRVAGTAAFTARVGVATAFSAGIGMGFSSGKVGARAGVAHEW